MLADEAKFLKEEGAAAVLMVSEKWYGLLNMGTGFSREYQPGITAVGVHDAGKCDAALAFAGCRAGRSRSQHARHASAESR